MMMACTKTAFGIAIGNGKSHMAGELDGSLGVGFWLDADGTMQTVTGRACSFLHGFVST
jgi:hypothetical protein